MTGPTAKALLTLEQTRSLLDHAYGENSVFDDFMDRLTSHEMLELHATGKDPCIFTSRELIKFGFNPDDLELQGSSCTALKSQSCKREDHP